MANGVQDCRCGWDQNMLAKPLCPIRPLFIGNFNNHMIKLRHITNRWDQIVMQVFGETRLVIFHQSHANALRNTAFNLTFDKQGVNCPPDIMRCCDLIKPHTAKRRIDRQFNDLCAIAKYSIGNTLPLFIKRAGWRIIGFFGHKHIAIVIDRHICQGNA